jgi:hypothetical protein
VYGFEDGSWSQALLNCSKLQSLELQRSRKPPSVHVISDYPEDEEEESEIATPHNDYEYQLQDHPQVQTFFENMASFQFLQSLRVGI